MFGELLNAVLSGMWVLFGVFTLADGACVLGKACLLLMMPELVPRDLHLSADLTKNQLKWALFTVAFHV